MHRVGLFVSERTLTRAIRGRSREKLHLYHMAARRHGLQVIFFAPNGLNLRQRLIVGYVRVGGRFRRVRQTLPRVVFRRIIPSQPRTSRLFRQLSRLPGVVVFNPPAQRNKLLINRFLARRPEVADSIPPTILLRSSDRALDFVRQWGTVYAKPALGSVGKGVYRIRRMDGENGRGRYELRSWRGTRQVVTAGAVQKWLKAHGAGRYILQQGIDLARYRGRPFDVRVTVQRDGTGTWGVTGMVAKVAPRGKPVTNLGRGGRSLSLNEALAGAFSASDRKLACTNLRRLGLQVARELSRRWPDLADLGLDLALDRQGRAWFLEANLREQRPSFREAGGSAVVRRQYAQPMAYAAHLTSLHSHFQASSS